MKATAKTTTRVVVTISMAELVEMVRKAGIHVPPGADVSAFGPAFDEYECDGVVLEWTQDGAEHG
jgi:hypothetical protein